MKLLIAFSLGWTAGCLAMWFYFIVHRLIRSREEWIEACRKTDNP